MSQLKQANLAKLAEIKLKLKRDGFTDKIPMDKRLYPRFLRDLRVATELSSASFWGLFQVPISSGYKYENPSREGQRYCPQRLMDTIAAQLDLQYTTPNDADYFLHDIEGLTEEDRTMLLYIHRHNLTLKDLKNINEIKILINR